MIDAGPQFVVTEPEIVPAGEPESQLETPTRSLGNNSAPLRVLALVNNPCIVDARVMREAEALSGAGHEVLVLAHWAEDQPEYEVINNVTYKRLPVRYRHKVYKARAEADRNGSTIPDVATDNNALGSKSAVSLNSNSASKLKQAGTATAQNAGQGDTVAVRAFQQSMRVGQGSIRLIRRGLSMTKKIGKFIAKKSGSVVFSVDVLDHAREYTKPGIDFRPDVVHAHDLYTLLAGRRIARRTGAKLVYDSHELEVGRNGDYSPLARSVRGGTERALIGDADAVITVSDSIADFLADRYKITRPTVIHNAPSIGKFDTASDEIRSHLGLESSTPLALYVGTVTINRGVENCVRALAHAPDLHLACIGKRYKPVEETMLAEAARLGVRDRLYLVDPVPHDQVTSFLRTGDVSLVPIQDVCLSYRFCFPNKLMESLLTGLPVVVARLVELERIVERTGAGVIVDETDPEDIARGIMEVVANRDSYILSPDKIDELTDEFGWQAQKSKLLELYANL